MGQREENEREDISITYTPLRPSTQTSDLKKRKVRQPDPHSGSASRSDCRPGSTHNEPPPILPIHKTIITGASRSTDSTSPRLLPNNEPFSWENQPLNGFNIRLAQQFYKPDGSQKIFNSDPRDSQSVDANMGTRRRSPPGGSRALVKDQSKAIEDRKADLVPQFAFHYQSAATPHKNRLSRNKLYEITEQVSRFPIDENFQLMCTAHASPCIGG